MKLLRRHDAVDLTAAEQQEAAAVSAWLGQVVEATSPPGDELAAWVDRMKVPRQTRISRPAPRDPWKWRWTD